MTWYAHNLYAPATEEVLQELRENPVLRPHLRLVRDLRDYRWYTPERKHDLGGCGLAVIRPLGPRDGDCTEWYECQERMLSWDALEGRSDEAPVQAHTDPEDAPPLSLLRFCRDLSGTTGVPVMYYWAMCWGGDTEFEGAWVFDPDQHTFILNSEVGVPGTLQAFDARGNKRILNGQGRTALTEGLALLGVNLPTPFFALHTRGFPWNRHMGVK